MQVIDKQNSSTSDNFIVNDMDKPVSTSALFEPFDEEWSSTTRSIRIDGTVTSVRLENFFWRVLGDVANEEGLQVPQLLTRLSKISRSGETTHSNFTSFIRVCCGRYIDRKLNNRSSAAEGSEQVPSVQLDG